MRITVIGSGSAFSGLNRYNSCYFVEAGDNKFLIDCGSDALRAIQAAGLQDSVVNLFSIQEIFITHMHADHCGGIPAVLTAMHVLGRKDPIRIHIPTTQLAFAKTWLDNLFIYNDRMSFEVLLLPLDEGTTKLRGGVELEFVKTKHLGKYLESAEKAGVRPLSFSVAVVEGKKRFFFSSDVSSLDEVESGIGGSVSLIEAAHPKLEEIARLSKNDNPGLFFTHIPQELEAGGEWMAELTSKFGVRNLNMVRDGQVLIV